MNQPFLSQRLECPFWEKEVKMEGTKILVIEDETEARETIIRCLKKKGYLPLSAETVKEGLEMAKKEHPPITLLDIRLTDGSGLDVLKGIKELDKNMKVIVVSALNDEVTIHQAKTLGADDYVTKPLTIDFLDNMILEKISELNLRKTIADVDRETAN
jgi:DNA-binding response OmpR family regulator